MPHSRITGGQLTLVWALRLFAAAFSGNWAQEASFGIANAEVFSVGQGCGCNIGALARLLRAWTRCTMLSGHHGNEWQSRRTIFSPSVRGRSMGLLS